MLLKLAIEIYFVSLNIYSPISAYKHMQHLLDIDLYPTTLKIWLL